MLQKLVAAPAHQKDLVPSFVCNELSRPIDAELAPELSYTELPQ